MKEDVDVDFRRELDRKAVVLSVEQLEDEEDMAVAHAAGRLPPFQISREAHTVLIDEEAQKRGLPFPFFENPVDRKVSMFSLDVLQVLLTHFLHASSASSRAS